MRIALIAHDKKKPQLLELVKKYEDVLGKYELCATGTTGTQIMQTTQLNVQLMASGAYGGDQQIGSMVASKTIDIVIFLRDPLTPQPHEPDISALLRLCDVHNIPLATNYASGEIILKTL